MGIPRHYAAPKTDVDEKFSCGRGDFFLKSSGAGCGGDAVERHFNQRGDAASSGSARGRRKTFPFRAARFVDVHVGIDKSGHHDKIGCFI